MVYDVYMLIRTQVLFPEEVYRQLKIEAALRETSVSKLVTGAVNDCVIKKKKRTAGGEFLEYLAKHAYKGRVPKDLSSNDDYLYGMKGKK